MYMHSSAGLVRLSSAVSNACNVIDWDDYREFFIYHGSFFFTPICNYYVWIWCQISKSKKSHIVVEPWFNYSGKWTSLCQYLHKCSIFDMLDWSCLMELEWASRFNVLQNVRRVAISGKSSNVSLLNKRKAVFSRKTTICLFSDSAC